MISVLTCHFFGWILELWIWNKFSSLNTTQSLRGNTNIDLWYLIKFCIFFWAKHLKVQRKMFHWGVWTYEGVSFSLNFCVNCWKISADFRRNVTSQFPPVSTSNQIFSLSASRERCKHTKRKLCSGVKIIFGRYFTLFYGQPDIRPRPAHASSLQDIHIWTILDSSC